jgi:hypothetical protein
MEQHVLQAVAVCGLNCASRLCSRYTGDRTRVLLSRSCMLGFSMKLVVLAITEAANVMYEMFRGSSIFVVGLDRKTCEVRPIS